MPQEILNKHDIHQYFANQNCCWPYFSQLRLRNLPWCILFRLSLQRYESLAGTVLAFVVLLLTGG